MKIGVCKMLKSGTLQYAVRPDPKSSSRWSENCENGWFHSLSRTPIYMQSKD